MEIQLLTDIFKLFGVSVAVLFLSTRLRIPTIVAFLVAGTLAGPHGFGFVEHTHGVEVMAEVGVVLLLFAIGMEFSIGELVRIKKPVLIGGSLQVFFTFIASALLSVAWGLTPAQGIFTGFLLALSSTAIVLKLLQVRGEMDSPHGKAALGILIFQDIAVVPMMLTVPLLAGASGNVLNSLLGLGKGVLIIAAVFAGAVWVVPRILYQIARTRDREFFMLSIVVICLGVAWATNQVGLSLSLGAFLAGLIISESEYSHHAIGNILPFKNVFTTIFFVSIGMLLDFNLILEEPLVILALTAGVLLLKTSVAGVASLMLGYPLRTSILVGLSLSQIGEFSFVLAKSGLDVGLIPESSYQLFLAVSVLSMAFSPVAVACAPFVVALLQKLPLPHRIKTGSVSLDEDKVSKNRDHLIIIGYGINGRNLSRAARANAIAYDIIEMNPDVVREEKAQGESIWYGDAAHEAILQHVNAAHAKVIVIAVSDPVATRQIAKSAREINRKAVIIVRTRYVQELKALFDLGVNQVIPEEFETSIQIFSKTLVEFGKSQESIDKLVAETRQSDYLMFRDHAKHEQGLFERIQEILVKH